MTGSDVEDPRGGWQRVKTRDAIVAAFADRPIFGPDTAFTINASGELTGTVGG